jgi:hypothetical protein
VIVNPSVLAGGGTSMPLALWLLVALWAMLLFLR